MATEEVGVVELRVRGNEVCLSHPRRSKAMCRGCLRPPRNVQRLPPRAAPAGNRGMVFTHEVVSTAVYTIYRIRSPKDGGAHIHRYLKVLVPFHCQRNSVLSILYFQLGQNHHTRLVLFRASDGVDRRVLASTSSLIAPEESALAKSAQT